MKIFLGISLSVFLIFSGGLTLAMGTHQPSVSEDSKSCDNGALNPPACDIFPKIDNFDEVSLKVVLAYLDQDLPGDCSFKKGNFIKSKFGGTESIQFDIEKNRTWYDVTLFNSAKRDGSKIFYSEDTTKPLLGSFKDQPITIIFEMILDGNDNNTVVSIEYKEFKRKGEKITKLITKESFTCR